MGKALAIAIVAGTLAGMLQAEPATAPQQPASGESVRVAVCQMAARDGKIDENLAAAAEQVRKAAAAGAALCVFPELIDVGFGEIVKAAGSDVPLAQPIPGRTSRRLGEIARRHGVWISAAILEKAPGGAYDTNVVIDSTGLVVHKQRKAFVYPAFAGTTAFQGNYLDARAVDSPWGPLAVINCADAGNAGRRRILADQNPAMVLVNFANPQANLLAHCANLARQCACPVIGANMVFTSGANKGGRSQFVTADGRTLWQAGQDEAVKTLDLSLPATAAYSDGAEKDVTRQARHKSSDAGVVAAAAGGEVRAEDYGEAVVVATYLRRSAVVRVAVPQPLDSAFPQVAENNEVDRHVPAKRDPQGFAEVTALVFIRARIGCARCHAHPTEDWTLDDSLPDEEGKRKVPEYAGKGQCRPKAGPPGPDVGPPGPDVGPPTPRSSRSTTERPRTARRGR